VADAYAGAADKNRDNRLEPTELFEHLQGQMAAASPSLGGAQSPELFLPDDRPPRLSEDAKKAIRKLAAFVRQDRPPMDDVAVQYESAVQAAGKEVEPKVLYGLLLMKSKQTKTRDEAMKLFDELKLDRPELVSPLEAIAWLRFDRLAYEGGVSELVELVGKLAKPKSPSDTLPADVQQTFVWCGQLREFAAEGPVENKRPSADTLAALDAAVAAHGPEAETSYEQGRTKTRKILNDYDQKIAASPDEAEKGRLKVERRRLLHYADFPFDQTTREILGGLDN
jgi:hypothetical protein